MNAKLFIFLAVVLIVNSLVANPLGRILDSSSGWIFCTVGGLIKAGYPCIGKICMPTVDDIFIALILTMLPMWGIRKIWKNITKVQFIVVFFVILVIMWLLVKVVATDIMLAFAETQGFDPKECELAIPLGVYRIPYSIFSAILFLGFITAMIFTIKWMGKQFRGNK